MDLLANGTTVTLSLGQIGEGYRRYRLADSRAEQAMARSLQRHGQISPIVVCLREEKPELIDGFTRLAAARSLPQLENLSARILDLDERDAKAALYSLNSVGRRPCELEEAWIVHALVREDGLSQVEAAELLGRSKSWACRRLALLERLSGEVLEDLRLGLVTPSAARQLTRLPTGNQAELLTTMRRDSLSAVELTGVVDLLLASPRREQEAFILAEPRTALSQAKASAVPAWDARLSSGGNQLSKRLGLLLDQLGRMENWLRHCGRADLSVFDRGLLKPSFARLGRDAGTVAALAEDFVREIQLQ